MSDNRLKIYHVAKGVAYHLENSIRGIRKAARLGYGAIDLDLNMTKDGVIVCTHWNRALLKDGFVDPLKRIQVNALISELTWAQVKRLRAPEGYRIQRLETMLRECKKNRIIAYLEPKGDKRFELDITWVYIKAAAKRAKCKIRVRSIRHLGGRNAGVRRVRAARRQRILAKVIY